MVGTIEVGNRQVEYGYSSGIYTRFVSKQTPVRSAPTQEEIDALGPGKSIADWERRFELAYQTCKDANVTLVGGRLSHGIALWTLSAPTAWRLPRATCGKRRS